MKTKQIIKALRGVLNLDDDEKKRAALETVLRKLKKKENKFTRRLETAVSDAERAALMAKLKVAQAHRDKGLKALREFGGET